MSRADRTRAVDERYDAWPEWWEDGSEDEVVDESEGAEGLWYEIEDEILDRLSIDTVLESLTPRDRAMMELLYAYRSQQDYVGLWPPTTAEVGAYLSRYCEATGVMPDAPAVRTVWRWHEQVVERWERECESRSQRKAA